MLKKFDLDFGDSSFSIQLPRRRIINEIEGRPTAAVADIPAAVAAALQAPFGTPPLSQVVQPGETVVIIVSDITRRWIRHDLFLPPLLNELNQAGIPDSNISLLVALGAHRRHTLEEHLLCYGQEIVERIVIEQSYGLETTDFVYAGTTSRGTETYLNRRAVEADRVILTGGIVYHMMAGFGGGRKSVLPGVSSYSTIQANHRFCLHPQPGGGANPNCDAGRLDGNPMHEDAMEIAAMLQPDFLLNAVFTAEGEVARFVAGAWDQAWLEGCQITEDILGVPISHQSDLVIASGGGFPKDINLYQGIKSIYNACQAAKPGGVIIVSLECRDIYEPPEFCGWFDLPDTAAMEQALRLNFTVPGFIALKMRSLAQQYSLIAITLPENKHFMNKAGIAAAATWEEACLLAEEQLSHPNYTISVMTHGATTVPLLRS